MATGLEPIVIVGVFPIHAVHHRLTLGVRFDPERLSAVSVRLHLFGEEALSLEDPDLHRVNHFLTKGAVIRQEVDHPHGTRLAHVGAPKPFARRWGMLAPPFFVIVYPTDMPAGGQRWGGGCLRPWRAGETSQHEERQGNNEVLQGASFNWARPWHRWCRDGGEDTSTFGDGESDLGAFQSSAMLGSRLDHEAVRPAAPGRNVMGPSHEAGRASASAWRRPSPAGHVDPAAQRMARSSRPSQRRRWRPAPADPRAAPLPSAPLA